MQIIMCREIIEKYLVFEKWLEDKSCKGLYHAYKTGNIKIYYEGQTKWFKITYHGTEILYCPFCGNKFEFIIRDLPTWRNFRENSKKSYKKYRREQ